MAQQDIIFCSSTDFARFLLQSTVPRLFPLLLYRHPNAVRNFRDVEANSHEEEIVRSWLSEKGI